MVRFWNKKKRRAVLGILLCFRSEQQNGRPRPKNRSLFREDHVVNYSVLKTILFFFLWKKYLLVVISSVIFSFLNNRRKRPNSSTERLLLLEQQKEKKRFFFCGAVLPSFLNKKRLCGFLFKQKLLENKCLPRASSALTLCLSKKSC